MPTPYEYVKFTRQGATQKEKGLYLPACTDETGNYSPRRVATVEDAKEIATILPLTTITIVKE